MGAKKLNPCECIAGVNKELAAQNVEVSAAFTLSGRILPIVATNRKPAAKRQKPYTLVATYCPFCGVKL